MFIPFHDDNPTQRTPVVTFALIGLNVAALFWLARLAPLGQQLAVYHHGFVPARIAQLTDPDPKTIEIPVGRIVQGPVVRPAVIQLHPVPRQIFASLVTCMFLHAGWMHLIGNMWFLWLFGNNVEDRLGHVPFLLFYLAGGLAASGVHWAMYPESPVPVIGASGAVAAVLGAYAVTWPWARVHTLLFLFIFITIINLPALFVLGVWFVGQLIAGRQALQAGGAHGVAWWAHIGGFLAGMALMPLLRAVIPPPRPR